MKKELPWISMDLGSMSIKDIELKQGIVSVTTKGCGCCAYTKNVNYKEAIKQIDDQMDKLKKMKNAIKKVRQEARLGQSKKGKKAVR